MKGCNINISEKNGFMLPLPVSRKMLKKYLRGAMLRYSPEEYSLFVYLCGLLGGVVGYLLSTLNLFSFLNSRYLITLFFAFVSFFFALVYPIFLSRGRKTGIDLKLPHAITYMRSLCDTLPLYDVIKQIFLEKDLYGEVSEEFGFIVRDVELLGANLSDAISDLMLTTPSENLKEFLQGLLIVFESGQDLKGYMSAKAENFRDKARKQLEINMKTLEILAEVFAVLFVALPVFLIIVITTSHILGKGTSKLFYLYLYLFMPVGGIALIYILDLINVKEDLSVTKVEKKDLIYSKDVLGNVDKSKPIYIKIKSSVVDKLSMPFKMSKKNYYYSLLFSPLLLGIWYLIISHFNFIYIESKLALLLLLFLLPLSIAFEYRARFVRKVEKETPDLIRQILSLKDIGLTLHGVIRMLKESRIGVLSREIKLVESDIEWGTNVKDALVELINRVGVSSIRRAITLLLRASEVTENIRDVLLTAVEDFEYELKMKDMRFASGFAYLAIIYLSYFILLYISYSMVNTFLSELPNYAPSTGLLSMMYQISFMLAVLSGIVAGQLEKGHILYGLKHVFIFLISSIIMFELIIPGINIFNLIKI